MQDKNQVIVQEPTFLSMANLHYRLLIDEQSEFRLSELKKVREDISKYRVQLEQETTKSR